MADNERLVAAIRAWQKAPNVHPLTCGVDSRHALLVPEIDPDARVRLCCPTCSYRQMVTGTALEGFVAKGPPPAPDWPWIQDETPADSPAAALPEIRVEHDSLTAQEAAAMRDFHREIDTPGSGVILFQRDAEVISALIDEVLADRDRLQRRVEELEAALRTILTVESGHTFGIGTDWRPQYDRVLRSIRAVLTSETPHAPR